MSNKKGALGVKGRIKISFIVIIALVFVYEFISNTIIKEAVYANQIKNSVLKIISYQESMNYLIKNVTDTTSLDKLQTIKPLFGRYEKNFEEAKHKILSDKTDSNFVIRYFFGKIIEDKDIKSNLKKLYQNERSLEISFDKLYGLQIDKLNLLNRFKKLYQKEKKIRYNIETYIYSLKNIELERSFANMKYYSKEFIFQYRDKKSFRTWYQIIFDISSYIDKKDINEYKKVVNEIGENIFKSNFIQSKISSITDNASKVIKESISSNMKITNQIDTLISNLSNIFYKILFYLSIVIILLIVWIAFKVSKYVGLSIDEINRQVEAGLKEIKKLNKEIVDTQKEVVFTMGSIAEKRSKETGNHVKRVAKYSYLLAKLYGLGEKRARLIEEASPMHDIGKVAIPDSVLNKPGRLDDKERKIMNTHAKLGYDMLKHSDRAILKTAAIVAYEHHEKWDGSGYPRRLKGEEISIEGRITALADVFDALGSDRVYKKAWSDDKVFKLLKEERGKHFDPRLVDIFFDNLEEFLKIRAKFKDSF